MTDKVKFTFDTEFEDVAAIQRRQRLRPVIAPEDEPKHSDNQLDAAESKAFERGRITGIEQAGEERESIAANALTNVTREMQRLTGVHETIVRDARTESITIGVEIARMLAGEALSKFPVPEIEALIRKILSELGELTSEPKIVVSVNPSLVDIINDKLRELKVGRGFAGQIMVSGFEDICGADCRVDWAEGGYERNLANIDEEIKLAVDRFIHSIELSWTQKNENNLQNIENFQATSNKEDLHSRSEQNHDESKNDVNKPVGSNCNSESQGLELLGLAEHPMDAEELDNEQTTAASRTEKKLDPQPQNETTSQSLEVNESTLSNFGNSDEGMNIDNITNSPWPSIPGKEFQGEGSDSLSENQRIEDLTDKDGEEPS